MKVSSMACYGLLFAAIMAPTPANAAAAYVPSNLNLRAGPDISYPVVARIPGDTIVGINGCVRDWSWCDVSWTAKHRGRQWVEHGWVSGRFLQHAAQRKNGQWVIRPRQPLEAPLVRFDLRKYWDKYYRDMNFYRDRSRYERQDRYSSWDRDRWDRDDRWRDRDDDRWDENGRIQWND